MPGILAGTAVQLVNRLLARENWARGRLTPFAGQTVRVVAGAVTVPVSVAGSGLLAGSDGATPAAVTVVLPPDWPLRAVTDRASIVRLARISGAVDFAETLGFVMRNLSWDIEGDLAGLIGDVAAYRVVRESRRLAAWHREMAKRLSLNVAEYLVEEKPIIARRPDLEGFYTAVDALREDCARLERRLQQAG